LFDGHLTVNLHSHATHPTHEARVGGDIKTAVATKARSRPMNCSSCFRVFEADLDFAIGRKAAAGFFVFLRVLAPIPNPKSQSLRDTETKLR
jgi:hypothetical protein